LYGLTETSALGVSCKAGDAIHLMPEQAFAEVVDHEGGSELVVTTLGFDMPLLRYPTGDRVQPVRAPCGCGLDWPRVRIRGRTREQFSLFESQFTPDELALLLLGHADEPIQVVLTDKPEGGERMILRLPTASRPRRAEIRARLWTHPLLGYLLQNRLVEARLRFVDQAAATRKPWRLIDRRRGRSRARG
jgi:phenylacetate-CoA ligase